MARSVAQAIAALTQRFTAIDPGSARLDARLLTAHALGLASERLFACADMPLAPAAEAILDGYAARRLDFEPVSRITGRREFWSLEIVITPDTLDPRADTETLVAAVLAARPEISAPRILDLGTGSGCILLAIVKDWPAASGIGVDVSPGAVEAAASNARRLGLEARAVFRVGNWDEGLAEKFDLIVSNPPYIPAGEIPRLDAGVARYDPQLALDGGADGLAAFAALLPGARRCLRENGRLFIEIGAGQAPAVAALLEAEGWRMVAEHRDLAGIARCLEARLA